ncbi:eukaryotic translation initiation factor 3 subunit f [Plakobranchus ocellatus]|uniref:Eukaryotic translation initiation factor 3 subunit f n=1 Tax=Plakobranchus ocellatus TaxID=259542 RepID=A0AAV4AMY7_9GAST|nr:eukaryotic translation initiation factor 3 subunit f [Plakobranchus ocellatus]
MAAFKELLEYFPSYNLNGFDTLGRNFSQNNKKDNEKNSTGSIKNNGKDNRSRNRNNSTKTRKNFDFDYSRWATISNIYGRTTNDYTAAPSSSPPPPPPPPPPPSLPPATTTAKHTTAKDLIHEFSQTTSMHGVSHIAAQGPAWRRILWSILVICFVAWAIHNVAQILSDYNSHPVMTSVSSEYQSKMDFPAVTICNLNRIRLSHVHLPLLEAIQHYILLGLEVTQINTFINLMMRSYNSAQQRDMGHQIEDMLFRCNFGHELCTPENFTYAYNVQYGNCYTFASNHDPYRKEWTTMRAGPKHGLSVVFDIQYDEYMPTTPVSGLKVLIHDNGEVPFPEDGGVTASTAASTSIAVRKTQIKRLAPPYTDCIKVVDFSNKHKNLFAELGYTYTLNACQKSCLQTHNYKTCNCCDSSLPCIEEALRLSTGIVATQEKIPACNTSDYEIAECMDRLEYAFSENRLDCINNCPPACEESSFSTTVSTGRWPTENYWKAVLWQMGYHQNVTSLLKKTELTFLKLEIYFDSLTLETIINHPAYTWNKLLSDIGGQLGLLLGFSILTAIEIVELVVVDLGLGLGLRSLWSRQIETENSQKHINANSD